ncbi:hypothetical protein MTO96_008879 [Rhipicephalus appendiculatus]
MAQTWPPTTPRRRRPGGAPARMRAPLAFPPPLESSTPPWMAPMAAAATCTAGGRRRRLLPGLRQWHWKNSRLPDNVAVTSPVLWTAVLAKRSAPLYAFRRRRVSLRVAPRSCSTPKDVVWDGLMPL